MEENKRKKNVFGKIINILLWLILLAWMVIVLMDFFKVNNKEEARFCIDKGTTEYSDGEVSWCLGLGYKVYRYKRDCFNAIEFGPFWNKDRSVEEDGCK